MPDLPVFSPIEFQDLPARTTPLNSVSLRELQVHLAEHSEAYTDAAVVNGGDEGGGAAVLVTDLASPTSAIRVAIDTYGSGGGSTFTPRGAWVSGTSYAVNDVVTTATGSYWCTSATSGSTNPASDGVHWQAQALNGAAGTAGSIRYIPWQPTGVNDDLITETATYTPASSEKLQTGELDVPETPGTADLIVAWRDKAAPSTDVRLYTRAIADGAGVIRDSPALAMTTTSGHGYGPVVKQRGIQATFFGLRNTDSGVTGTIAVDLSSTTPAAGDLVIGQLLQYGGGTAATGVPGTNRTSGEGAVQALRRTLFTYVQPGSPASSLNVVYPSPDINSVVGTVVARGGVYVNHAVSDFAASTTFTPPTPSVPDDYLQSPGVAVVLMAHDSTGTDKGLAGWNILNVTGKVLLAWKSFTKLGQMGTLTGGTWTSGTARKGVVSTVLITGRPGGGNITFTAGIGV